MVSLASRTLLCPLLDAKLQEAQGSLVKSSYVTMKMAEDLAQAQARGDLSPQLYDVLSDHCLHAFTFNSVAVQQLDQVRRLGFKPVLPTHLKGLAKVPPSPHSELFGNDLPARQKELKDKSSRNPGDLAPGCSMTPFYEDGRGFVLNGKSIPCLPLSSM